jgi:hypothetical protein
MSNDDNDESEYAMCQGAKRIGDIAKRQKKSKYKCP